MRHLVTTLSFFILLPVLGCVHSASRTVATDYGRVYALRGLHPDFGTYQGELELRDLGGGQISVTRIVAYDQYRFENLGVQEVWQGIGAMDGKTLVAQFLLKKADVFIQVDSLQRSPEDFQNPLKVSYRADFSNGTSDISADDLSIHDQISTEFRAAEPNSLWKNERQNIPSKGDTHRFLGDIAMKTVFVPALRTLAQDPFAQKYLDRPEFKSKTQYFIFDPTDFDFLRAHPDVIRVANKKLDRISLVESSLRRDAYAPNLETKSKRFDQDIADNFLNEVGLFAGAHFDSNGQRMGYFANGDGLLWSGMYAGAQAMRWQVTRDPAAMIQFKKVLRGLVLALDVTGDPNEFARTVHPIVPGETLTLPWRQGAAPFDKYKYIEGGNNDMAKGFLYAFAWAYQILPENDPVLAEISARAPKMVGLKVMREINHPANILMAKGLAALAAPSDSARREFIKAYWYGVKITNGLGLNSGFYYGGIADWSGINLGSISQVAEILITQNILKKYKGSEIENQSVLRALRENLMTTWSTYASARRGFLTVAAHTFALANDQSNVAPQAVPVRWNHIDIWPANLQQAVWLLREVPLIRVPHSLHYDFSMRPDWSLSGWPRLPWKYWNKETEVSRFYQGAYDFPIFEGKATETDNYWISAFGFRGGASAQSRYGRVDYLHMYWMGRLGGLVSPAD